jgi:membrane protein DedA with SNARE-associated domain
MTTPQTPPPSDPKAEFRKQFISALVWTIIAAVVAVFLFVQVPRQDDDKKTFYIIAGVIAVVAALVNGYAAWNAHQKSKLPPAA